MLPKNRMIVCAVIAIVSWFGSRIALAQEGSPTALTYRTELDIPYRSGLGSNDSMSDRCRIDLYYPTDKRDFATVVWFHGGGLTSGNRSIPDALKNQGFAVAAAGYRLSPAAKSPEYIEDAAAAVAWAFKNIESYGGAHRKIFVAGHSAGGYLTMMIGLDTSWLKREGVDANQIAGLIPYSGQAITHFTIRAERGVENKRPVIDGLAPLFHVRKDAPPILLTTADRDQELLGRYEENAYLWRMMKEVGHPDCTLHELQGYSHGDMVEAGHPLLIRFVKKHLP